MAVPVNQAVQLLQEEGGFVVAKVKGHDPKIRSFTNGRKGAPGQLGMRFWLSRSGAVDVGSRSRSARFRPQVRLRSDLSRPADRAVR